MKTTLFSLLAVAGLVLNAEIELKLQNYLAKKGEKNAKKYKVEKVKTVLSNTTKRYHFLLLQEPPPKAWPKDYELKEFAFLVETKNNRFWHKDENQFRQLLKEIEYGKKRKQIKASDLFILWFLTKFGHEPRWASIHRGYLKSKFKKGQDPILSQFIGKKQIITAYTSISWGRIIFEHTLKIKSDNSFTSRTNELE